MNRLMFVMSCLHKWEKIGEIDSKYRCENCTGLLSKKGICRDCGLPISTNRRCEKCEILLDIYVRSNNEVMGVSNDPPAVDNLSKIGSY